MLFGEGKGKETRDVSNAFCFEFSFMIRIKWKFCSLS